MPKARIMIVEDEWLIAEDIQTCVLKMGYDVSSTESSGPDAIEKAEKDRPDLILMDIVLKGEMSGIEAAEEINERFNIPHIFLTSYADQEMLKKAKTANPYTSPPKVER